MNQEECPACGEMVEFIHTASMYGDVERFKGLMCPHCNHEVEEEQDNDNDF